jgi:hypothetical protein
VHGLVPNASGSVHFELYAIKVDLGCLHRSTSDPRFHDSYDATLLEKYDELVEGGLVIIEHPGKLIDRARLLLLDAAWPVSSVGAL